MKRFFFPIFLILVISAQKAHTQHFVIGNQVPVVNYRDSVHFTVAQDGSGDFTKVQDAINAVPDYRRKRTVIFIKNGVYHEKLILPASKQLVTFLGEDVEKTILTYNDWAQKLTRFGEPTGTSGSASFFIYGRDFYAENITFRNDAGPVGQAVAVHVSGDRCVFYNCKFIGHQDTLFTYADQSRQYYLNCYIEGTTDFIFGWSTAVFESCIIHSKRNSYITAAATLSTSKFGYLFYKCKLTADPDVTKVYLGRPWRDYAKTVFRDCYLGSHILPEGWHNWSRPEREKTTFFAEYNNCGPGANANQRVLWSHILTDEQALLWTVENVLAGNDGWNPKEGILKEIINFK